MLTINYDEHCAYKPFELGIQLAQHITNKIIPKTFRFIGYEDRVVKDGDRIDDSKHTCTLLCLDDAEGTETGLKCVNDIAAMLVGDKKIRNECGEKEGVYTLFDDEAKKYKVFGPDADKRVKGMFLDYALFKRHQAEAAETMSNCDIFGWDSSQRCYFTISNINENGMEQFRENGLDYLETFKKEEFARAAAFCRKHWPDFWQELTVTSVPLDMTRRFYDEEDKAWRRIWKYAFRISRKDGTEIEGEHALRSIGLPEPKAGMTGKDCAGILGYYADAGTLRGDDMVVMLMPEQKAMLYIKSETEIAGEISEKFRKARLKDVIETLKDDESLAGGMTFADGFEEFMEAHKDEVFGKVSHLKFGEERIFAEKADAV